MKFDEMTTKALEVRELYDKLNQEQRNIEWNGQDLMAGFVGDVGSLSKIIMAKHGLRAMENVEAKLAHELADCLWSVLVLAEKYDVNLEAEFLKTMGELKERIARERSEA